MRAMVVRRYGPPEVFESREVPDPQPKPGEVLIRVKAIGVNFADLLQRMGLYPGTPKPPFVPGIEISGVVEKVAAAEPGKPGEAETFRPGDAVAGYTSLNAYGEWAAVPARQIFRLPPGMPFEDAAAIPVNYLTAYHSMFAMGNLQSGDRILIHSAAGGVGIAAVQLARAHGVTIFGTAGPAKQEMLRRLGVEHAINYEKDDFVQIVRKYAPDGIEMVMDPIGGKSFARSQQCLGPTGRLVIYGFSAAAGPGGKKSLVRGVQALLQTPRFHPLKLMRQNTAVIGVNLGRMPARGNLLRGEMDEIFRMYTGGKIKPVIGKTFPLASAAAAHQYIHERKNIGKVILAVK
ncbi:MAG TPA: medium chain dehydrogenase/reductase family protein [Candidatus Acidoferrales bacterium]|nr:medium chain dehydrogenase/reductase family protein [Candidatus Acidoferrales bacterium]